MDPKHTRPVLWIFAALVTCCCSGAFYTAFFACPVSEELRDAKHKIVVGMTVGEARRLVPTQFYLIDEGPDAKQYGTLRSIAETSMRCHCELNVTYRAGVVTKVELWQYDDFRNHRWAVE